MLTPTVAIVAPHAGDDATSSTSRAASAGSAGLAGRRRAGAHRSLRFSGGLPVGMQTRRRTLAGRALLTVGHRLSAGDRLAPR